MKRLSSNNEFGFLINERFKKKFQLHISMLARDEGHHLKVLFVFVMNVVVPAL